MTLHVRSLQVDVPMDQLDHAARFWSGALTAEALTRPGGFVHLVGASSAVEVHLHPLVSGPARYHLDLAGGPRSDEVERLVRLGAREVRDDPGGWTVMADPAGLPFCVVDPDRPINPLGDARPDGARLDALFVDVPADLVDVEVAFWSAVFDGGVERQAAPYDEYTGITGVAGPGGPVKFEIQRVDAPPRYHVDLSAADVPAEAARLELLGAERVAAIRTWVTLATPAGNLLCVVPDD